MARRKKTRAKPSPAIKAMQLEMQAAGQYSGPIDGLSGPKYDAAITRRDNAAQRASNAQDLKTQSELAKAATAKAQAAKAQADARAQDNSWQNKLVTLGGQGAAVGIGAYAGHKISSGTKKLMLSSQMAVNRQLLDLGKEAAPLVKKGIVNKGGAYYAKSLAGQLKNIKSPKTVLAGLGLSAFLAGDAAFSHFVGREKAKDSGSKAALMAVDAFTATTALASTANLAYTVQSAVMLGIQKETVAAAKVKAAAAMADDFLATPKGATANAAVGKKNSAKATKPSAPKPGSVKALSAEAKQLGLKVQGNGQGGRVLKADLQAALKEAAKVTSKGNPKSPWRAGAKALEKTAGKLPGSAKLVGLVATGVLATAALTNSTQTANASEMAGKKKQGGTPILDGFIAAGVSATVVGQGIHHKDALLQGLKVAGRVGKFAVTRGLAPIIAVSAAAQAAYNTKGGAGAKAKAGTKAGAYAGITTAAFMAGPVLPVAAAVGFVELAHAGYKDVQKMKTLDAAGQAKWHKDKRTAIAGGSLQQKFSALSPAQKAKFQTLDKAGRKAMLTGGGKSQGGAYLNKSAAEKAKTSPKAKAKTGSSKRDAAASPKRAGRFYTRVVNGKSQRVKNPNYGK